MEIGPQISIVIPVKNGALTLKKCLESIFNQTIIDKTEVIIIDSGSTDQSLEIIKSFNVRLYQIPPEEFSHGGTRNYGVNLAKGEFVVMTVQDAIPATNDWLEIMLKHFEDPKVSLVVGQQVVPHDKDKNPHQWFRPVSKPRVREIFFPDTNEYLSLPGIEQDKSICYDDTNCMYRKSELLAYPFPNWMFGEDMYWAREAVMRGSKIIYNTNSTVWHYHYLSYSYVYQLKMILFYYKNKIFNYRPIKQNNLKIYFLILFRNIKYKASLKWIIHNIQLNLATNKAISKFNKLLNSPDINIDEYYKVHFPSIIQGKQMQN